jgi:hypothetical protein
MHALFHASRTADEYLTTTKITPPPNTNLVGPFSNHVQYQSFDLYTLQPALSLGVTNSQLLEHDRTSTAWRAQWKMMLCKAM